MDIPAKGYWVTGGQPIAANTTKTQLVLTAAANRIAVIDRVQFGQDGHNNSETVLLEVKRATAAGSGGSAVTPQPDQVNQGAAGYTCSRGPTTEPTYAAEEPYLSITVNTALGRDYVVMPPIVIPPGGIVGIRIVNRTGNTNITSERCAAHVAEVG